MRSRAAGFTLIEVLIALAIMAVGVTAAIGLFTAATSMHKRAIDETTGALLADAAIARARGRITMSFSAKKLEVFRPASGGEPPVLYLEHAASSPDYPAYVYDVLLTPVRTTDVEEADAFHIEVRVRIRATDRPVGTDFRTVILRRVTVRDLR